MKQTLTKQEEDLQKVVRDRCINRAFKECGKGIDKVKFEEGMEWIYSEFLKLTKPHFEYCDSLIEAIIKITMVKDFKMEITDYPKMYGKYMDKTLDTDFVSSMKENQHLKSSYVGWSNFGWVSFYDYFTQIGVLNDVSFNRYQKLTESNVFETFEFENVVFAVQPPEYITSENDMPHNMSDYAIKFQDGTGYYFVDGVNIAEELFLKLKNRKYTFEDFIQEENEEVKSTVLRYIERRSGTEGVFDFMRDNLKEVDSFINDTSKKYLKGTTRSQKIGVYTLFKGKVNDISIAYVRCYCPSTDRMFFLGVEPKHTSAKDAIASLYRIPTVLKNNIVSISRQGEKFSTLFDDTTTKKLENEGFSTEELQSYSDLPGDTYFKLMTYEF